MEELLNSLLFRISGLGVLTDGGWAKRLLSVITVLASCLCLQTTPSLSAQGGDYTWLFGYDPNDSINGFGGSLIHFGELELPTAEFFNIPCDFSANAAISDSNGDLIAYSNGCAIYNSEHSTVNGADSINGGFIADFYCDGGYPLPQGVVFVPVLSESDSIFRLLHLWRNSDTYVMELRYTEFHRDGVQDSIVVLASDVLVHADTLTKDISCTRHANGRDWWILMAEYRSNKIFKYLSHPDGVELVDSQLIGDAWDNRDWSGQAAFSRDGDYYARINPFNGLSLYEFDRCTGDLHSYRHLTFDRDAEVASGVSFSASGRYLYASTFETIFQIDLQSVGGELSRTVVANYDGFQGPLNTHFFQHQIGPDGKIYMTSTNSVKYLHVIERPDRPGLQCKVLQHSLELPTLHAFSTPNFPNYRLGPLDGSTCDTLGLNNYAKANYTYEVLDSSLEDRSYLFTDLSYYEPTSWSWSFGDGMHSTESSPIHQYSENGVYRVCLTVSNDFGSDSLCKLINVNVTTNTSNRGVDEEGEDPIDIYPNPFMGRLFISSNESTYDNARYSICVFDMNGRRVMEESIVLPALVDLSDITPGIYSCIVRNEDEQVVTVKRLVKVE